MRTRWRRWSYGLGMAAALAAGSERTTQAGPIIDWFKSWCQPPPSTCSSGNCNTPKPNPYYPAANTPPVLPGPVLQPGAAMPPGAVIQPGAAQPGFLQPNPSFPNTVTPGPAFGPRTTNFAPLVSQATYYPPTNAYAAPAATYSAPVTTYSAPVTTYSAPTARTTYYAPTTTYAPVAQATYYAPTAAANCPTCPTAPAPGTMGAAPGMVNAARPTIVNYAPYLSYRDQWIRVPVTYYRPVSVVDPATGIVTTAMQPCSATAWQVQRVPVGGRSFFSRYQPATGVGGTAIAAPPAVVMPNALSAQPGGCVNGLCPTPGYSGLALPMAPSIVAAPITPSAPTIITPSPAMGTAPGAVLGSAPAAAPPAGTTRGVIADTMPQLQPGEGANSANYPPLVPVPGGALVPVPPSATETAPSGVTADAPPFQAPLQAPADASAAPATGVPNGDAAGPSASGPSADIPSADIPSADVPSADIPSATVPPAGAAAPDQGGDSSGASGVDNGEAGGGGPPLSSPAMTFSPTRREAAATAPSARLSPNPRPIPTARPAPSRVTPVPDPDAVPFRVPEQPTPRLIVPRDRVASAGPVGNVTTASSLAMTAAQPARRVVSSIPAANADRWDDSGWRSAAPASATSAARPALTTRQTASTAARSTVPAARSTVPAARSTAARSTAARPAVPVARPAASAGQSARK